MKNILVPTDFSAFATSATRVAAQFAKQTGARITLLHNVDTLLKWEIMSENEKQRHHETFERTMLAMENIRKLKEHNMFKGLKVSKVVTHGITYEQVVQYAAKLKAGLIIIGSHGSEASPKFFIGSNVQKILREAGCPVLSVKKDAGGKRWKNLVFAANFDEDLRKPFEQLRKVVRDLNVTIHLIYVNTPAHFKPSRVIHQQMDEFASNYPDLKFTRQVYNQFDLDAGILEYAQDINADWIAMVTHDRKRSPKYLIGVTESIVYHADAPVLSVNITK